MATYIDPSRYVVVPRATVRRQLALGRVLVRHKPVPASDDAEYAAKLLAEATAKLTQAFADRHLENSSSVAGEDAALDMFVDDIWRVIDDRLQHWKAFERPAAERLAEAQDPEGFDYEAAIEKARKAGQLWQRLLGDGLSGLRLPHAEQAEFTRTLWTVIDQNGLEPQLVDFVGVEFVAAARDAQDHYDEMVDAQSARTKGSLVNLRELATKLVHAIQKYMISVVAMNREDDPEIVARVQKALRPIDALRERLERERGRGGSNVAKETQADIDELINEEQAVVEAIGAEGNKAAVELGDLQQP